ncbi:hypothetical protein BATDEDRAFT_92480 [Batrachochytrium dendrobatidis JAM81]|uniref:Uncharacterized protein n=1 Tax=Batrachochytrium dendrobatidis (strain JAM81 / FGSC 10211) TaxID=684364 RepID=F4PDL1_BATDJ|nr:uncharacterized protein BATDEDRAFT_92480 [Batrachochytrium dendrobatidis JAM81]EGF76697.1 hypothetical protein BATDEDRAFT_92480 [Batrachochytrium dendrobatidis JAM81]|eukprot:XP_006682690.1 hypothetical protein BATDEDRAFT_92480 [Batrachochytrium dendrobatidis JAM81]
MQNVYDYEADESEEATLSDLSTAAYISSHWVPSDAESKLKADVVIFNIEPMPAWSVSGNTRFATDFVTPDVKTLVAQCSKGHNTFQDVLAICHVYRLNEHVLYTETSSELAEAEVREWTATVLSNLSVQKVYVVGLDLTGYAPGVVASGLTIPKALVKGLSTLGLLLPKSDGVLHKAVLGLESCHDLLHKFPIDTMFEDSNHIIPSTALYV